MSRIFLLLVLLIPISVRALELDIPINCNIGINCFIQNYVDVGSEKEWSDYNCGKLSYDKHKGTDFRLRNFVEMRGGVDVLASASGIVRGVRDGMKDVNINSGSSEYIKDRECGNGIAIAHGNNWETQYCHMMNGSVLVKEGESVKQGQKIGKVGLSGRTEFPHLHLSVRHKGKTLDPFTGKEMETGCGESLTGGSLWNKNALNKLKYIKTALLNSGVSGQVPESEKARNGKYNNDIIDKNSEVMIIWVDIMGIEKGDILNVDIIKADGKKRKFRNVFDNSKVLMFSYNGLKLKEKHWPVGRYTSNISLTRDGKKVFEKDMYFSVK